MNQSVMMTTAANKQNSRTGLTGTMNQNDMRSARSVSEVMAILRPTLLRPRPILTGTE